MADTETKPTDPTPEETQVAEPEAVLAETLALIESLQHERDQLKDQLLRALADLKNVRRRHEEDRRAMSLYATEDLVRSLLPVLDNFERTLLAVESGAAPEAIAEGLVMVEKQLRSALAQRNLVRIEALGLMFDPDVHEAIAHDESSGQPAGTITAEIEPGYKMGDRVIRPARVRVAK